MTTCHTWHPLTSYPGYENKAHHPHNTRWVKRFLTLSLGSVWGTWVTWRKVATLEGNKKNVSLEWNAICNNNKIQERTSQKINISTKKVVFQPSCFSFHVSFLKEVIQLVRKMTSMLPHQGMPHWQFGWRHTAMINQYIKVTSGARNTNMLL